MEACAAQWPRADQSSPDVLSAMRAMISGTEDDLERAEQLIGQAKYGVHERVRAAFLKATLHRVNTGHPLPFNLPFLPPL